MLKITFHGHSCFQLTTEKASIIIDPFLNWNPVAKVKAKNIEVQYILLSHGHGDHVGDTVEIAKANNAVVIAAHELATYMEWQGVTAHGLGIGGGYNFDFGRVKLTQAFHSSSIDDEENKQITYMGMPTGILITIDDYTIYHAGDTGLFSDMKMIGELNQIDLAMLPIGDNYTMGPEDAVVAAQWLNAKKVMPMHYNTFPLLNQDGHAFGEKLKQKGIEGIILSPGESYDLPAR